MPGSTSRSECVDAERGSARRTADVDDLAVGDGEGGFDQLAADQRLAAFDFYIGHCFKDAEMKNGE